MRLKGNKWLQVGKKVVTKYRPGCAIENLKIDPELRAIGNE
jgi:hypothetical protein